MFHDPGAILISWVLFVLISILAVVIIKNVRGRKFKHDTSDFTCHHTNLDNKVDSRKSKS
ncbi:MAG: hypothetical protein D8M58_17655 [Calditrichaeota bacterium]|nr:MAG: hypothetical protein DWQ03_01570 [Calditrichota bacterium]MBL1207233.1 hypothetical protein [Calditrichota bacterium]NOG47066.1 hypothetical protein [Calditrichota bacterium]